MAHFAKLGINSKVIGVHVIDNSNLLNADGIEEEEIGRQFLEQLHGWPLWAQTSYNTYEGVHKLGGTPLRKNYAGVGMIWDEDKDMFYLKQPYASWILDESTGQWEPPTPTPKTQTDGVDDSYAWDETTKTWNKE
jgi:hypothetical protein